MLLVYAAIIAFGLNEFRKTPIGFIPALDRGYAATPIAAIVPRPARAHQHSGKARTRKGSP